MITIPIIIGGGKLNVCNLRLCNKDNGKIHPISLALTGIMWAYRWAYLNEKVRKILVTLDITTDVVDEAVEMGADMIVAHHPLIFKP